MGTSFFTDPDPSTGMGRFIIAATTPGVARRRRIRQVLAVLLLIGAVVTGAAGFVSRDPVVVTVTRPVDAGDALEMPSLAVTAVPARLVPDGAVTDTGLVAGRIAATPFSPHEVVTTGRLVGEEAVGGLGDPRWVDPSLVPVSVADQKFAALIHHGDTVTVITGPGAAHPGAVIAQNVRVVMVVAGGDDMSARGGASMLLACDGDTARVIAAAAADEPVGVVITGTRARGQPDR